MHQRSFIDKTSVEILLGKQNLLVELCRNTEFQNFVFVPGALIHEQTWSLPTCDLFLSRISKLC